MSVRGYDDDWDIGSATADLRLRHELANGKYLQPHVRYYTQEPAGLLRRRAGRRAAACRPTPRATTGWGRCAPRRSA